MISNKKNKKKQTNCKGPEADIHQDSLKATAKKFRMGKFPAMMAGMDSGLKQFTSIHERLALVLSRCREEARIRELMTWRKLIL